MAMPHVPDDFKEFLKLLHARGVKYLLVGGYAVCYHGYPRATADLDVWVARTRPNAKKVVAALREFGFAVDGLDQELFLKADQIVRMGVPPLRLEILTSISGVAFAECYRNRVRAKLEGVPVSLIGLHDLKRNKLASGRHKDLDDLEHLEG